MRTLGRSASLLVALLLAASPVLAATPLIEDQRPVPGALIGSDYPSIFARFDSGSSAVDAATVRVTVDGVDVTPASTVSSTYVTYTPSEPLENGRHTVMVNGRAADGSAISSAWWFNVETFGAPPTFGFFPPGFSLFVPGPLFFVSGNVIVVVLVSEFFPFGTGFCTIGGVPGIFPFLPWPNWPGHFFARIAVPRGVVANAATVAAHFTASQLGTVVVHSAAPVTIDGTRVTLPPALHYAVMPRVTAPARITRVEDLPPPGRVYVPHRMDAVRSEAGTMSAWPVQVPTRNAGTVRAATGAERVRAPLRWGTAATVQTATFPRSAALPGRVVMPARR